VAALTLDDVAVVPEGYASRHYSAQHVLPGGRRRGSGGRAHQRRHLPYEALQWWVAGMGLTEEQVFLCTNLHVHLGAELSANAAAKMSSAARLWRVRSGGVHRSLDTRR
jgi:hypothetical protein